MSEPTRIEMSDAQWDAIRELKQCEWVEEEQAWISDCPLCNRYLYTTWTNGRLDFLCVGKCTHHRIWDTLVTNRPVLVPLSTVEPTRVGWLWQDYLPLGKVVLLDGDPSLGKTTLMIDVAARLSRGQAMPGCETPLVEAASTILISQEDGAGDTLRPRLDLAGADATKVVLFTSVKGKQDSKDTFMIPENVPALERAIRRAGAKLVVIDPIMGFLKGDSHRDQDMKRALAPLAEMAEKTGACVVLIRHLRKSAGPAMYRGSGAIGIAGTARVALMVVKAPDGSGERLLGVYKSNVGQFPLAWRLKIAGEKGGASHVEWLGQTECDLDQVLASHDEPAEKGAVQEACVFLKDALKNGPVKTKELEEMAQAQGLSTRSLRRAAGMLKLVSRRHSDGTWSRDFPDRQVGQDGHVGQPEDLARTQVGQQCELGQVGHLGRVGHLGQVGHVVPLQEGSGEESE